MSRHKGEKYLVPLSSVHNDDVKNLLDELEGGALPPALQALVGRAFELWERRPGSPRQ